VLCAELDLQLRLAISDPAIIATVTVCFISTPRFRESFLNEPRNTADSRAVIRRLILAELTVQGIGSRDLSWCVWTIVMFNELAIAAAIVSVSLIIHMAGILLMAEWLLRRREELERNVSRRYFAGVMVMLFGGILLLHLIQTSLWALFYYTQELFSDFETSLYFSMVSFTTIGYGDVLLPRHWRLLGVIEGFSGVLLCGVSTGFIFAVINAIFQSRLRQRSNQR
jgi:voltage-gated potassium channel